MCFPSWKLLNDWVEHYWLKSTFVQSLLCGFDVTEREFSFLLVSTKMLSGWHSMSSCGLHTVTKDAFLSSFLPFLD